MKVTLIFLAVLGVALSAPLDTDQDTIKALKNLLYENKNVYTVTQNDDYVNIRLQQDTNWPVGFKIALQYYKKGEPSKATEVMSARTWGETASLKCDMSFYGYNYKAKNCVAIKKNKFESGSNYYTFETIVTHPNDASFTAGTTTTKSIEGPKNSNSNSINKEMLKSLLDMLMEEDKTRPAT